MRHILSAVAAVLIALPLGAATLEVKVAKRGGAPVDEAVVYAVPSTLMPLERKVAVMDQVDRTFVPHVLPVQTGTWVEFPNSDNIRHQVFSLSPARRFQLPLYVGKPARPIQFPEAGIVAIGCNIHEQMNGYIVVVDTPYFATTVKGVATIPNVAAGDYTLRVWHPGMKNEPKAQALKLGASDKQSLTIVTE